MAKDFRNIEYHTNQDGDGLRYYACSTLNTKRKELSFHKNKGAIVQIKWEVHIRKDIKNLSETFNFTPELLHDSGWLTLVRGGVHAPDV